MKHLFHSYISHSDKAVGHCGATIPRNDATQEFAQISCIACLEKKKAKLWKRVSRYNDIQMQLNRLQFKDDFEGIIK